MFSKILASRILAFFGQNSQFFQFFSIFIVISQVSATSGVRKSALGFDNKLLEFFGHGFVFYFVFLQVLAIFFK